MEKLRQVTIVHGLPDTNSGGAALGISLIRAWERTFPKCKILYVSHHGRRSLMGKAHPFVRQACRNVDILPFPVKNRIDYQHIRNSVLRRTLVFCWGLRLLLTVFFLIFPRLGRSRPALQAIESSDLVLSRGTNIFWYKPGYFFRSLVGIYSLLFPLLYAYRVKTPFVIYGHSFGPLPHRVFRWLVGRVLRQALLVLPREKLSEKYLIHELKVPRDRIEVVPDSVFALRDPKDEVPKFSLADSGLQARPYMCVTVRSGMTGNDSHLETLAGIIDDVLEMKLVNKCAIVTQCHQFDDYSCFECDSRTSRWLRDLVSRKERIVLLDAAYPPDTLVSLYSDCRFVLGMRLHSVILSLVSGTPAIALSYFGHKTQGIMHMADLDDYTYNYKDLDRAKVVNRIAEIVQNEAGERQRIVQIRERLFSWASQTPSLIADRWERARSLGPSHGASGRTEAVE